MTCRTNNQECIYGVSDGETGSQVLKRKYELVQQERDELRELFSMISGTDPGKSMEVIQRVRAGQDAGTILKQIQHGDVLLQARVNSERHARQILLSSLMQTSASFDDMVEFISSSIASSGSATLPNAAIFRQLRGQKTDLDSLRGLLGYPVPQRRIAVSDLLNNERDSVLHMEHIKSIKERPSTTQQRRNDQDPEPPCKVPANPWTTLTTDDSLVSHLVSIFLEWVNPSWRLVEEDLFVEAMQSGDLNSEYCSPFLVNAILSLAAVSQILQISWEKKHTDE